MTPPGTSISGPSPILTAAAREIEKATIPCPHCVRGTILSNGAALRCHFCGGTARVLGGQS